MPISPYLRGLRAKVGTTCLLLPGVAAIIRDEAGRILLIRRREDNLWSLPAGGLDPGEEPAQGAIRECWEETGLVVCPERLAGVFGGCRYHFTYPNGDEVEPTLLVFECRIVGGSLEAVDGEAAEFRYFAPADLPPLVQPYPEEFLSRLDEHRGTYYTWSDAWLEELRQKDRDPLPGDAGPSPEKGSL